MWPLWMTERKGGSGEAGTGAGTRSHSFAIRSKQFDSLPLAAGECEEQDFPGWGEDGWVVRTLTGSTEKSKEARECPPESGSVVLDSDPLNEGNREGKR